MFPQKRRSEYRKQYKKFVISCEGSVTDEQLDALFAWAEEPSPIFRGVALSNPKFELWLLAHFMDLPQICGPSECDRFLRSHMSVDGKHIIRGMSARCDRDRDCIGGDCVVCP